jgi:hypothetical protein
MNSRISLAQTLFALVALAVLVGPARSETPDATAAKYIRRKLQEVIETKDLSNPMTLKEALIYLREKHNLMVLVDLKGFAEQEPDGQVPYEVQVQLPFASMKLHAALQILVNQIPARGTFLIRDGRVDIVPASAATSKALLGQRVLADYSELSLREMLDDLSAKTGAAIILDARAKDRGQERVSMTLNNLSLEDALVILTRQAGLRYETLETSIFVTVPDEARPIEKKPRK